MMERKKISIGSQVRVEYKEGKFFAGTVIRVSEFPNDDYFPFLVKAEDGNKLWFPLSALSLEPIPELDTVLLNYNRELYVPFIKKDGNVSFLTKEKLSENALMLEKGSSIRNELTHQFGEIRTHGSLRKRAMYIDQEIRPIIMRDEHNVQCIVFIPKDSI